VVHKWLPPNTTRADVKRAFRALAERPRADGRGTLAVGTRSGVYRVLRLILAEAVEDELLLGNPAAKLGRKLKLTPSKQARQEAIKAMSREQLQRFLATSAARDPRFHVLPLARPHGPSARRGSRPAP